MAAGTREALVVTVTQQRDDLGAQLAAGHGIDGLIDRFMREADGSERRGHAFECTGNLLGTEAGAKIVDHHLPQRRAGNQAARHSGQSGLLLSPLLCLVGPIAAGRAGPALRLGVAPRGPRPPIAPQLAANRRRVPFQGGGNGGGLETQLQLRLDVNPIR